ncbi:MAG: general secretion pathway protein GspL, partial [Variovorax sp.]
MRWRSLLAARRERLLLQVQGEDLRLRRDSEAGVHDIASLPLPLSGDGRDPLAGPLRDAAAELPRWLLLPAAQGLRRSLVLPGAARERLREVLAFEIERQTPFGAA